MPAHPKQIEIATEDRPVLEKWANARATERRLVDRARIVLLAAEARPATEIAERVGCSLPTVKTWRARYERDGLEGLRDRPKTGRPLTHGPEVRAKLIALACTRPPDAAEGVRRERWTYAELAEAVGMSESQAHAILAGADLRPHLTERWVMSELGPGFDAQAAEVCGLYLDPPRNAIVISLDEKTSIAAREPARRDTSPAPGRPARRDSEYLRHGTTNLFAALRVHSGQVSGMTAPSRATAGTSSPSSSNSRPRSPPGAGSSRSSTTSPPTRPPRSTTGWPSTGAGNWSFTPTHASWLNQVEIFFSILARRVLRHGQFTGPNDLATQMLAFVEHHNLTAQPFSWTYTGKVLAA